jgi:hypothetical protein
MTTSIRLVGALVLLCCGASVGFAQKPVAPAPHLTLDELVKEYQRYGLPVPPKEAELVRVKLAAQRAVKPSYTLGFLYPPAKPGGQPRLLQGYSWTTWFVPEKVTLAKPIPASTEGVALSHWDWLCLAAQCKIRGWDDLAAAAYTEALLSLRGYSEADVRTVSEALRESAWTYWKAKLWERDSDRKEIYARLCSLHPANPKYPSTWDDELLRDLEPTLVPRKSKPGTAEALIDDLTDYWDDPDDPLTESGHSAFWKLVELGFDAVPALIEHAKDYRLTREKVGRVVSDVSRVGDLCEGILSHLSAGALHIPIDPGDALKWWGKARQYGEELWLIDHFFPSEDEEENTIFPSEIMLRVIRAKYRQRFAEIYQTVLYKRPKLDSEQLTKEIAKGKFTRERKLSLLEEGASHRNPVHCYYALNALSELDDGAFRKHLFHAIQSLPQCLDFDKSGPQPVWIAQLISKTDDRKCWDTYTAATMRASGDCRISFIRCVGWPPEPGEKDSGRKQSIHYLLGFFSDTSVGKSDWKGTEREARDVAAIHLGYLLGIVRPNGFELSKSPRERFLFRDRIREAAERELARPTK